MNISEQMLTLNNIKTYWRSVKSNQYRTCFKKDKMFNRTFEITIVYAKEVAFIFI